jgi:D-alanyl-lipoteichoic acid acyltransferase DltB (MBOAT superfamily)
MYLSLVFNISLLGFFKYIPAILGLGHSFDGTLLQRMVIPIGLSFFSFQAMGYMIDLYWSNKKEIASFPDYALFMSFFPQLLAGPIARGKSFLPQIQQVKRFEYDNVVAGLRRILWGIFKKVVIAGNLSPYTDAVFQNPQMHQGVTLAIAAFAYTIQIYMDFSGYSDIAIGSAKVLGFNLMENFRIPLFARSVTDFWRRWHISLSSWVRDYVFVPLQYQTRRMGMTGTILATLVTFLIFGVWHGANWTLVIFGLMQGVAISWETISSRYRDKVWSFLPVWLGNAIANILVFVFITVSAIFLRAASLWEAVTMFSRFSLDCSAIYLGSKQLLIFALLGMAVVLAVDIRKGEMLFSTYLEMQKPVIRWAFYILSILSILLIGSISSENFIYFQF